MEVAIFIPWCRTVFSHHDDGDDYDIVARGHFPSPLERSTYESLGAFYRLSKQRGGQAKRDAIP